MPIISKRKLFTNVAAYAAAAGGGGGTSTNTWNPADVFPYLTFSNGNKTITKNTGSFFAGTRALDSASTASAVKYYWEITITVRTDVHGYGIANAAADLQGYAGKDNGQIGWAEDGNIFYNNGFIGTIQGYAASDTICLAWDAGNQKIWFRTNGGNWNNAAIGSQNPATNTGGTSLATLDAGPYYALAKLSGINDASTVNFGATAFAQTMPSGFSRWP